MPGHPVQTPPHPREPFEATLLDHNPARLTRRLVSLNLVTYENAETCPLWVTGYRKGTESPRQLFGFSNLSQMIHTLNVSGINEAEPLMIADTVPIPARYSYLIPSPQDSSMSTATATDSIVAAIKALQVDRVGFYFAPKHFGATESLDYLGDLLSQIIHRTNTTSLFLLPGNHGINAVLNMALKIKFGVESDQLDLKVFH